MRSLVRSSLALMGLTAVLAPCGVFAQTAAPAGYAPAANSVMVMGPDGKPVMAQPAPAPAPAPTTAATPAPAPARHAHKLGMLSAHRAKKPDMTPPTGRIVACAHSKNGVCPACRTLLEMPGTFTMGTPASSPSTEAPGRAMVSHSPTARPAAPGVNQFAQANQAVYDPSMSPEPTPIGVMQTNYAQPGMVPAAASGVPTASSMQPGHALAASGASPAPFQHKSTSSVNPHVIGHIFGYSGVAAEWREERNRKKAQAHASIPYNNEGTTINEIPSSMVYGNR